MRTAQKIRRARGSQVKALKARLAELEDTLSAIQSGAVDALLIGKPSAEQVFTLKGAEQPYRVLIETINEGAVTLSLQGTILYSNRRFAELVALPLEQTIGASFQRFVAPAERAAFEALLAHGASGSSGGEILIHTKDGKQVPVLLSTHTLDLDTMRGVCMVVTDITQQKRIEAALNAANAELVRAAQLKDEFLAGMSHELRTPLNAVLGLSEALQEEIYGPINERQRATLLTIETSGRHLLDLINDILDLAKIGAGAITLEYDSVSIHAICRTSLLMVKQAALNKQLTVESNIDTAVALLHADARRLKQILVNLLSNAVKFTPVGGAIGLEVVGDSSRQMVDLTVWDTGIGIAPENLARLFQPFVQLDSRLSREYNGTGLGLALVSNLVELHGGSVGVTSVVGAGSRFTVSLPWCISSGQSELPAVAPAPAGERSAAQAVGILLAEDNEANSRVMSDYLEVKGYRVQVARNGIEAVKLARERRPALILMDIQMPGMDGLEAIRHIRAQSGRETVPIVALTALAMPGDRERCLAAGADAYLGKPVGLKVLAATIDDLLRRRAVAATANRNSA
jgi:PAS domain S-box-containing protein